MYLPSMNELQRMQYLDAMGIEMFVPRLLLSHSAKSLRCELPVTTELMPVPDQQDSRSLPQLAKGVHSVVEATADAGSRVLSEFSREASAPAKLARAEVLLPQNTPSANPVEDVRFSLSLWSLENGVMIIDSREPRAAFPTDKLLFNILLSTGFLSLNLPRAEVLNWPLAASRNADHGWQAASDMVHAYLEASSQKKMLRQLVLMGSDAWRAVLGPDLGSELEHGHKSVLKTLEAQILILPSLVEILRKPEYKKRVWHFLSDLQF